MLNHLLQSKDPKERQVGQLLIGLEYENLVTALDLALAAQVTILEPYSALSEYLDVTQDQRRGLQLSQRVFAVLENYSPEKLAGSLGAEFVGVVDDIAQRQLALKQYKEAETSYQKALSIWLENQSYDADEIKKLSASIYHQLGMVAQQQRQWPQAAANYQQALQLFVGFNARYEQASTYHNLGRVAEAQRQWPQAAAYYQQALQIYVEFNDRYEQAGTYHQLGIVAEAQRQWPQAEAYYQQALQIFVEFNARYEQASTYHQLGSVAQAQQLWQQAYDYFLTALRIFIEYEDNYNGRIVLRSLARLWESSADASLPTTIASILSASVEETEKLLRELEGEDKDEKAK